MNIYTYRHTDHPLNEALSRAISLSDKIYTEICTRIELRQMFQICIGTSNVEGDT